jgi:hypothetical protein
MDPDCSLPHSKVPAICPYPEPEQPSPYPNPISWRSILILSSHLHLSLPSGTPVLTIPILNWHLFETYQRTYYISSNWKHSTQTNWVILKFQFVNTRIISLPTNLLFCLLAKWQSYKYVCLPVLNPILFKQFKRVVVTAMYVFLGAWGSVVVKALRY